MAVEFHYGFERIQILRFPTRNDIEKLAILTLDYQSRRRLSVM